MTHRFLDDHTTTTLTRDFKIIANHTTELLRIARRETSPPGGRAARNPQVPASRPPVNIGALSVAHELHICLTGWARCLKDATGIDLPLDLDDRSLALHLAVHAHRIAQQDWAADCADEISTWATTILVVTTPPPEKKLEDYTPAQRAEGMAVAKVDAVLCAELVAEWTHGTLTPKPDTIRRMAKDERINAFGPRGQRVYSPREVIDHMRHAREQRLLDRNAGRS